MNTIDNSSIYASLESLCLGENDLIANLGNISALLYHHYKRLNWLGFYLLKDDVLVLGPFQGKVACTRINKGKGVCGTAWETLTPQIIPDLSKTHNHIVCDSASKSEYVYPLIINDVFYGVLDIDSPYLNRFNKKKTDELLSLIPLIESIILNSK
jgi:GAF domain-containing protein